MKGYVGLQGKDKWEIDEHILYFSIFYKFLTTFEAFQSNTL